MSYDTTGWNKLKPGTPISGVTIYGWYCSDNLRVEAVGHDWAVLRGVEDQDKVVLLEPRDSYTIGHYTEE
jgi:hypothetical protein